MGSPAPSIREWTCRRPSLARGHSKARRLFAEYERLLRRVMKGYLRFVDAWYSKEFIEVFLYPQDVLQIPPAVNAVLGGNISGSFQGGSTSGSLPGGISLRISPTRRLKRTVTGTAPAKPAEFQFIFVRTMISSATFSTEESPK